MFIRASVLMIRIIVIEDGVERKGSPYLPKAQAKANAWKTNKTVPRSPRPQTEDPHVTLWLWGQPTCLQECTRGPSLTTVPSSNPSHESAVNEVEGSSTLVLTVHGGPHTPITQAVTKLLTTDVAEANALLRPA